MCRQHLYQPLDSTGQPLKKMLFPGSIGTPISTHYARKGLKNIRSIGNTTLMVTGGRCLNRVAFRINQ